MLATDPSRMTLQPRSKVARGATQQARRSTYELLNAQNWPPFGIPAASESVSPALTKLPCCVPAPGAGVVNWIGGKGAMLRLEPWGQDWMKLLARVKTARGPSGVSNEAGTGTAPEATRTSVWCRASMVAMVVAALRTSRDWIRGAAPR